MTAARTIRIGEFGGPEVLRVMTGTPRGRRGGTRRGTTTPRRVC
jgi:hypothetical protein